MKSDGWQLDVNFNGSVVHSKSFKVYSNGFVDYNEITWSQQERPSTDPGYFTGVGSAAKDLENMSHVTTYDVGWGSGNQVLKSDAWQWDVVGDGSVVWSRSTVFGADNKAIAGQFNWSKQIKGTAADQTHLDELNDGTRTYKDLSHVYSYTDNFASVKSESWQLDMTGDGTKTRSVSTQNGITSYSESTKGNAATDGTIFADLGGTGSNYDNLSHVISYTAAWNNSGIVKSDGWQLDVNFNGSVVHSKSFKVAASQPAPFRAPHIFPSAIFSDRE